MLYDKILE